MLETGMMGERVIDALASSGKVAPEQIASAESAARRAERPVGVVLLERGAITESDVAAALEETLGIPRVDLSSYAPDDEALAFIPTEVARARSVLPLFEIDSVLTVAIGNPADVFELDALADELRMEVEAVLVDPVPLRQALNIHYGRARNTSPGSPGDLGVADGEGWSEAGQDAGQMFGDAGEEGFMETEGTLGGVSLHEMNVPVACAGEVDLDVLAVADASKVAVLVSEILEHAVSKGATNIHLLPYKDDFFLAYRVEGRLENIASAPLSLQGALIDGFKTYAHLSAAPADEPALRRMHARVCGEEFKLTVSAVPTVSGQRLVVSIEADRGVPLDLGALGMSAVESRALKAMVERGKGILLVCGPADSGRSATYYALLTHAALAGRTVYSVEHGVEYEIPAVAQVLVDPASPVGSGPHFAAGMQQDTDVIAIDSLESTDDIHRAIEAAGLGKLVIATFLGGDIVSGVRRMLDLGVEPASLAGALTFGVGQRLIRTNCPACSAEEQTPLASRIPGAARTLVSQAGGGCDTCSSSGFGGTTALFEVLPFTEPVRAAIATSAAGPEIKRRALAAGMRPMVASGLAKVEQGLISADELNRVLRFAE